MIAGSVRWACNRANARQPTVMATDVTNEASSGQTPMVSTRRTRNPCTKPAS